jgi:hypothetical protein
MLLGGLAVEAIVEEDEGPLVEVAAAVGATVVDVVEQVVEELGARESFDHVFAAIAVFVHSGVMRYSIHMASSCVHD